MKFGKRRKQCHTKGEPSDLDIRWVVFAICHSMGTMTTITMDVIANTLATERDVIQTALEHLGSDYVAEVPMPYVWEGRAMRVRKPYIHGKAETEPTPISITFDDETGDDQ